METCLINMLALIRKSQNLKKESYRLPNFYLKINIDLAVYPGNWVIGI